jgi:Zn-dependent protease with chaperone function
MKRAAFVLLLIALPAPAQQQTARELGIARVERACKGPLMAGIDSAPASPKVADRENRILAPGDPLASPAFVESARRLMTVFKSSFPNDRVLISLTSNSTINAWTQYDWAQGTEGGHVALVCVPTAMVEFMGDEDELAFIIAHELGHAVDEGCRDYARLPRGNKALCEIRADEIGYKLMRQANYSPYAAAGAFGRIEMYLGDTHTGVAGFLAQLSSDHPITPNRIEHMRSLLIEEWRSAR